MLFEDPILRHSRRQSLLRQAAKLGISRFEASLLIAAVEYRMRSEPTGRRVATKRLPGRWPVSLLVGLVIAAEGLAIGGLLAWMQTHG